MTYQLSVVLPTFEGPLELLLHLLEKNDIDIYDIPIALITEQFIAYIEERAEQRLDDISEFVVMAAHLLEIKSKMLLPIHNEIDEADCVSADDPRYDLVQRLLQYKLYKDAAETLGDYYDRASGIYLQRLNEVARYNKAFDPETDMAVMPIDLLTEALQAVIRRIPEYDDTRKDFFTKLRRDQHTIEQKLHYLALKFEERRTWHFSELVATVGDKLELVVTFLALLEYMRDNRMHIYQAETFSDIIIEREIA